VTEASRRAEISHETGRRWFGQAGGVIGNAPRPVSGRYLSFEEREEIALAHATGQTTRQIGTRLGRHHTTISRELARNSTTRGYRAGNAQREADERARRPTTAKLAADPVRVAPAQREPVRHDSRRPRNSNPATGTNGEGTGASPDIAVPATEALDVAYGLARRPG